MKYFSKVKENSLGKLISITHPQFHEIGGWYSHYAYAFP